MGRQRQAGESVRAEDDRRYVSALARGLSVLRCFTPKDRWLRHQDLVKRTGHPHATVSRLAFTLVSLGYLQHRASSGEYRLSPAVLTIGFAMLSTFDIGRAARPAMRALAERSKAAVSLGLRHELSMVYVAHERSTGRLTLGLDVGTRLPVAQTAMGRAVLCALPDDDRDRVCRQIEAEDPARWPRFRDGLARALEQFATRGYVASETEWDPEISAIGVPIEFGIDREPYALTIGGPSSYLKGSFLHEELGPALVQAAADIRQAAMSAEWAD